MANFRQRWPWAFIRQALIVSILTAGSVQLLVAGPGAAPVYWAMMWGVIPLAGAATAFFGARRGRSGFLMFWLPCACQVAVHWLMVGMPPQSAGMPLVTALVSIVGAAAGEEAYKRAAGKRKK